MPAERRLPDIGTLLHWIEDEGMTHQECADRVYALTGERVTRTSISSALSRAGVSSTKPRHTETIPWRVSVKHTREYPARMLRLLGRRRLGLEINDDETQRLDGWLAKLDGDHAVVGYDPDSEFGFYYIEKDDKLDGLDGIPIRRQTVSVVEDDN